MRFLPWMVVDHTRRDSESKNVKGVAMRERAKLPPQPLRLRGNAASPVFIRSEFGRSMLNEHRGGDLTEWISDGDEIIVDLVGRYENPE